MWRVETEQIHQRQLLRSLNVVRYAISDRHGPLQYGDVIGLWQSSAEFRDFYVDLLRESSFDAYRWETPPINGATADRDFEFVLVRCDELRRVASRSAFSEHFKDDLDVVTFANLRGDATLVVPCPLGRDEAYAHLADFVRSAPPEQVDAYWQAVGSTMADRLGDRPVWLSTAGMGVPWLHVRLDSQPKYYAFAQYKGV